MSIRFAQLPGGSGFHWRGRCYSKVSPLEGQDLESGERRLVPRSAQVLPLDLQRIEPEACQPVTDRSVDRAIHGCLASLRRRLDDLLPSFDSTQWAAIDQAFQSAGEDLLKQLEIVSRRNAAKKTSPKTRDT